MANPQSRNEAILQSIVDETTYTEIPKSREEKLLLEIKDLIEQGGGTSDVQGLVLTMNSSTYVITAYLIDGEGHQVGDSQTIDLPLEATIIDASYNNNTKIITFTLTSGAYLSVPIGGIIYGLQPLIDAQHKLSASLVDDTQGRFKFLWVGTAAQWEIDGPNCPVGTPRLITDDVDIDLVPTQGSNNPVTSNGVFQELKKLKVINENPENHNGIYRGKDLTNIYTVEQIYERVHDGSFEDLYLGDYFTVSITTDIMTRFTGETFETGVTYYEVGGADPVNRTFTATEDTEPQSGKIYCTKLTKTENVDLMFAAFDYYYNMSDTALTTHHAVLIPRGAGFATTAKMNLANTTAGGYYGSDMHQITLPCYAKSLKTVLGNYLLSHKTWLTTTVNTSAPSMAGAGMTGAASASAWEATEFQLMNEVQIYGSMAWSSSAYDVGVDNEKLPVFNFINPVHFGRNYFWLRSVVSSTGFAACHYYGTAYYNYASSAYGVRPLILFG